MAAASTSRTVGQWKLRRRPGGGIIGRSMKITSCTITGNTVQGSGGGIDTSGDSVCFPPGLCFPTSTVKSSIVALNTATSSGPDVHGGVSTGGFNLIGNSDGSAGLHAPTDQSGTIASPLDPKLDPSGLQSNGGPTGTIALLRGSPAIDRGTSNGLTGMLTTDQRGAGFRRAFDDPAIANAAGGDGTDVGAFEQQTLDPFLSYAVKGTKGTPRFVARGPVTLADAFGRGAYDVAEPVALALPAEVDGTPRRDESTHLLEHRLKPSKGEAKFAPR